MKDKSITDVFYSVFSRVYTTDSYNPFKNKFNARDEHGDIYQRHQIMNDYSVEERVEKRDEIIKKYSRSYITMLASFLGLPNECSFGQEQSWYNIFVTNFLGWKEVMTEDRKKSAIAWDVIKNIIPMIFFYLPVNTLVALIQFPRNLLKLATEFLPLFVADLAAFAGIRLKERAKDNAIKNGDPSHPMHALFRVGYRGLQIFIMLPALALHFVGRAITSPVKGVICAMKDGLDLPGSRSRVLGVFLGIVLALLSAAITISVYAFLFPLILTAGPALFGINLAAQIAAAPNLSFIGLFYLGAFQYAFAAMNMLTPAVTMLAGIGSVLTQVFFFGGLVFSDYSDRQLARRHRGDRVVVDILEGEKLQQQQALDAAQRYLDTMKNGPAQEHATSSSHEINKSLERELSLSGEKKSREATVSSTSEEESEEVKSLSSSEERKSEEAKIPSSREEADAEGNLSNSLGDFFATLHNEQPVNDARVELEADNRASLSGSGSRG